MGQSLNKDILASHFQEAKRRLDTLVEVIEDKTGGGAVDANHASGEVFDEARLMTELAQVYHHLNLGWNMRHMDCAHAEVSGEMVEKWPLEFDQFFRDYDQIDEPIIEPQAGRQRSKCVDYDDVDIETVCCFKEVPILIGEKTDGYPLVVDLARVGHLLIVGEKETGKTMLMTTMLYEYLKRFSPEEMRFGFYDEKCVEFTAWYDSPYLFRPVCTEPAEAVKILEDLVSEMRNRLEIFTAARCRNIQDYNHATSLAPGRKEERVPRIVFFADEIAGLIVDEGSRAVPLISELAATGRSAGIHLVLATSQADREVLPVQLRRNINGRVVFKLNNCVESRLVLNVSGAQNLCGRGDLLFSDGCGEIVRAQGPYVSCQRFYEELERNSTGG